MTTAVPHSEASNPLSQTHYVNRLTSAADRIAIYAQEDIVSAQGLKLVAAGSQITSGMRERLSQHKLNQPLENTVQVGDSSVVDRLQKEAEKLLDERRDLRPLFGWQRAGLKPLDVMSQVRPTHHALSALSLLEQSEGFGLEHSALVCLTALGVGARLDRSPSELQELTHAGIFHDVGQLYVDPVWFSKGRQLTPNEWKNIAIHPIVGAQVLEQYLGFKAQTAQIVLESHERADQSGYPRRRSASALGSILAFAEQISGIAARHVNNLPRLTVSVKVLPTEHPREILSAFLQAFQDAPAENDIKISTDPADFTAELHHFFVRIAHTLTVLAHLENANSLNATGSKSSVGKIIEQTKIRFDNIQRAFSCTGLDMAAHQPELMDELQRGLESVEARVVLDELLWRLSELSRDIHLRAEHLSVVESEVLEPLIDALGGSYASRPQENLNQSVDLF